MATDIPDLDIDICEFACAVGKLPDWPAIITNTKPCPLFGDKGSIDNVGTIPVVPRGESSLVIGGRP